MLTCDVICENEQSDVYEKLMSDLKIHDTFGEWLSNMLGGKTAFIVEHIEIDCGRAGFYAGRWLDVLDDGRSTKQIICDRREKVKILEKVRAYDKRQSRRNATVRLYNQPSVKLKSGNKLVITFIG